MSFPEAIFISLVRRGLIAATPAPVRLDGGNSDRLEPRSSWKATAADGKELKLTLGPDLVSANARHRTAHAAAPDLVPAPVFFERLAEGDVLAEAFIDSADAPAPARGQFAEVLSSLEHTRRPSTAAARRNEWRRWTTALLELDIFTPGERSLLTERVLPALFRQLATGPASTRWSNGDFRADNVRVDREGRPWLIDHEHGARTHFFDEDVVRWFAFSPAERFQPAAPPPALALDPGWNLFFWLRQLELEDRHNTPAYLGRFILDRKAVIRRLAEMVCGQPLDDWSTASVPIDFALEDARWLQHEETTLFVSGWCHLPGNLPLESVQLVAPCGSAVFLDRISRPDVHQHFGHAADTQVAGFNGRVTTHDFTGTFLLGTRRADGAWLPLQRFNPSDLPARGPSTGHYAGWARGDDEMPARTAAGTNEPRFSILLPVYNTPPPFLTACVKSVFAQTHRNWELIVVDDGSALAGVDTVLCGLPSDTRVQIVRRSDNGGIARATNDALALARGEFIVLLDHDDVLRPHALHRLALAIAGEPVADVWYSDEDKISAEGRRIFPFFKPACSPEFLRSVMYPGHVLCVRRSVATAVGGFDPAYDGVQDYEFFLRLAERTPHIRHLPEILYHWRRSPGSSALHGNVKGDMDARQLAAVTAHLARTGDVRLAESIGGHRVRLRANPGARVPSRAVLSIAGTDDPLSAVRSLANERSEDILIVHGEPSIKESAGWTDELAALARLPDSGCVAPVLISAENRVLESGCTFAEGRLMPMMVNFDPDDDGYNGAGLCNREVAAVSPLCFALRRAVLLDPRFAAITEWGIFLEALRKAGLHHRVCAAARVTLPRRGDCHAHRWRVPDGASDPYYNPAFRRNPADYTFLAPKRATDARSAIVHHLDTAWPGTLNDGCLELRGWSVSPEEGPVTITADVAGIHWSATSSAPRPDVAIALGLSRDACGFTLNLRLPPGRHQLVLRAHDPEGREAEIANRPITVPRSAPWRRAFCPSPERLLACQLASTPQHAPRPLVVTLPRPRESAAHPWPRFSVATPSFQQSAFLRETIDSVLRQNVSGGYVIQDGASTDGSATLIAEVARPAATTAPMRLVSWESAPDFGQTDALQRAFAKTRGEPDDVMSWINSDDFYLPGAFAVVAEYFAKHPGIDVVYGHRLLVDESSREVGRWRLPAHDPDVLRLYDFVPQETMFWRRRLWDRVGGLDADFQFAMDWDLLLRFQAVGAKIVRLPHFLACFRIHPAQKTSAQIASVGQEELDTLRHRTFGRPVSPNELIGNPSMQSYLQRSARLDLRAGLGRFGFRG